MTPTDSPLLPDPLLRVVFVDGSFLLVEMAAFEALEAAWHLYAETGRNRVVTVRLISGGTASFKVGDLDNLFVDTAAQRRLREDQYKQLRAECPPPPAEGEEWKIA